MLQCFQKYDEELVGLDSHTLGLELGIPIGRLDSIRQDYPHDVEMRREKVIQCWMSSPSLQASWPSFVDALQSMDFINAARKIANEHGKIMFVYNFGVLFTQLKVQLNYWGKGPLEHNLMNKQCNNYCEITCHSGISA